MTMKKWTRKPTALRQQGVAAVEFALVVVLMLLLLTGLAVYWQIFQAQQSVARATGDGARMLQELAQGNDPAFNVLETQGRALIVQRVTATVRSSLAGTGLPASQATAVNVSWGNYSALLQVSYPHVPVLSMLQLPSLNALKSSSVVTLGYSS